MGSSAVPPPPKVVRPVGDSCIVDGRSPTRVSILPLISALESLVFLEAFGRFQNAVPIVASRSTPGLCPASQILCSMPSRQGHLVLPDHQRREIRPSPARDGRRAGRRGSHRQRKSSSESRMKCSSSLPAHHRRCSVHCGSWQALWKKAMDGNKVTVTEHR